MTDNPHDVEAEIIARLVDDPLAIIHRYIWNHDQVGDTITHEIKIQIRAARPIGKYQLDGIIIEELEKYITDFKDRGGVKDER